MAVADGACPPCVAKVVDFPDGTSYELLHPLANFRKNQDGVPAEGRAVFTCRLRNSDAQQQQEQHGKLEFVVKVKVQVPEAGQETSAGPSTTTAAELKALESFRDANNPYTPHLVAWTRAVQGPDGLLPGGYVTYTVMTKIVGQNLLDLRYWMLPTEEREEIVREFLTALRSIYSLGIAPLDRALRNVIWEQETKKCTIIDFELWRETTEAIADETKELQRWGLARRPVPRSWWAEWNWHDT